MAQNIENSARLTYNYGTVTGATVNSNLANTTLQGPLTITKSTLRGGYEPESEITNIITLYNSSAAAIPNVTVTDNLGTFTPTGVAAPITPQTYIGPAKLYINSVDVTNQLTVSSDETNQVQFELASLPGNSYALIVYQTQVNEFAPLGVEDGEIVSVVTAEADGICESSTATDTLPVIEAPSLEFTKDMSPDPVICGELLTYTMTLYNYGNVPATFVQMTDTFNPAPELVSIAYNGTVLTGGYTYDDGTGLLTVPSTPTADNVVPAATYVRNPATGVVSITPGTLTIVVTGRV